MWTFPPLLCFQSFQHVQIQLFSHWLSYLHFPTNTSGSSLVQTDCEYIKVASETGVIAHTHTHTHTYWEIFGMVSLGMSWHVWGMSPCSRLSKLSLALPFFSLSFLPYRQGQDIATRQQPSQHAGFCTLWPKPFLFSIYQNKKRICNPFYMHLNETVLKKVIQNRK